MRYPLGARPLLYCMGIISQQPSEAIEVDSYINLLHFQPLSTPVLTNKLLKSDWEGILANPPRHLMANVGCVIESPPKE